MIRAPVESSNIASIGYDPASQVLEVQFKSGGKPGSIYRYADVPADEHAALMAAESPGSHFARNIRGAYKSTRVEEERA